MSEKYWFGRTSLVVLLGTVAVTQAHAQGNDNQQVEERIEVTGSRLSRIDLDTASPVTIIDRETIEASAKTSLSDLLRDTAANTFGSQKEQSGRAGGTQSHAGINLRGLGQQRTLVLVNGRRIANSPAVPDSQNINLIPLSAIERVEILKDGASSIYGSDAVGGVVNIILRKNLNAHSVATHFRRPSREDGDENYVAFTGGKVGNEASLTYSFSLGNRDNIFNRDRELTSVGLSPYGFPGSYSVVLENPTQPGQYLSKTFADSRCPSGLNTSVQFPNSVTENSLCKFNFAAHSDHVPTYERASGFINGDWVVNPELTLYAQASLTRFVSEGTFAPTPQVGGVQAFPTMSANNVNNPTQTQSINFDTDGDGELDTLISGPFDLRINYRNVSGGNRLTKVVDTSINTVLGAEGQIDWNDSNYKLALQYNKNTTKDVTSGLSSRAALQTAIDNESFDLFGVNGETDMALARSFAVDSRYDAHFTLAGFDYSINTELGKYNDKPVNGAFGIDYKHHDYESRFNDPFSGDLIDGRAGGGSAQGSRQIVSSYAEVNLPTSKTTDLNFSLRFDNYSDFGSAFSPKLGGTWRYSDRWLYRFSVGKGFRAPSLFELYSRANQSFPNAIDELQCRGAGDADGNGVLDEVQDADTLASDSPCLPVSMQVISEGNEQLEAEDSFSLSIGTVYEIRDSLRVTLNYFYNDYNNQISLFSLSDLLNIEANDGSHPSILRDETGQIVRIDNRYDNFSGARTEGIDFAVEYTLSTKTMGQFKFKTDLSAIINYQIETTPGSGFINVEEGIGSPDSRFNMSLSWNKDNWASHLQMLIVPPMEQQNANLDAWTPMDLSLSYKASWGGHMTLGVQNLLDEMPPTSRSLGHPYYLTGLGDITGRAVYFRISQSY